MEKFLLNFKKIFINLQLVFLRTKLNFKAKKLGNLVMSFVVVFGILIIVGGKFVGVGNAAQQNIESSNMAKLVNTDLNGCYQENVNLVNAKKTNLDMYKNVNSIGTIVSEKTGSSYTGQIGIFGTAFINWILPCAAFSSDGKILGMVGKGTMYELNKYTANLYTNPTASTVYDIDQTIAQLNPIQTVDAQTSVSPQTGTQTLEIIRSIWESVRNITFLFYIVIFLVISFAIMFRQKIGGQTYVNVINSIPSIIISLVLVVFSYSISGLVISLGNASMSLIYNLVYTQVDFYYSYDPKVTSNNMQPQKLVDIQKKLTTLQKAPYDSTTDLIYNRNSLFLDSTHTQLDLDKLLMPFQNNRMDVFGVFGIADIGTTLESGLNVNLASASTTISPSGVMTGLFNTFQGILGPKGINALVMIVLSVAAFFSGLKLFFALLKEYVTLVAFPIISPIYFALSALPGKNKFIQNWLKTMAGSVFVFVAIYIIFVLIIILGRGVVLAISPNDTSSTISPMFLNLGGNVSPSLFVALVSYGLYILTPQIPKIVKDAIGAASNFDKYTGAIGNETKAAVKKIPGLNMIPGI